MSSHHVLLGIVRTVDFRKEAYFPLCSFLRHDWRLGAQRSGLLSGRRLIVAAAYGRNEFGLPPYVFAGSI